MRPLTDNEYKRIQAQAESRMAGMSEIGFKISAKIGATDDPPAAAIIGEWVEYGYLCDFRIGTFSQRLTVDGGIFNEDQIYDQVPATCALPMRYVYNDAFTVKSEATQAQPWLGKKFDVTQMTKVDLTTAATSWNPIVTGVVLVSHNNMSPVTIREFKIRSTPYVQADCFMLDMFGEAQGEVVSLHDDQFDTPGRHGYGYFDQTTNTVHYFAGGLNVRGVLTGRVWKNGVSRKIR